MSPTERRGSAPHPTASMSLAIEHDPAVIATMLGRPALECSGVHLRLGRPDEVVAVRIGGNPLDASGEIDPWIFDPTLPGRLLVSWSGSMGRSLFAADPRTWMGPGQARFRAFCDQVRPALEREERVLCIQPHHRHVISDVPGARRYLEERAGQPFGLALAPASMLDRSMLEHADDHLERIFAGLGAVAALVVLEDVADVADMKKRTPDHAMRGADDRLTTDSRRQAGEREGAGVEQARNAAIGVAKDGGAGVEQNDALVTRPLGQGVLPRDLVRRLVAAYVPVTTPIILRAAALDAQRAWLGLSG